MKIKITILSLIFFGILSIQAQDKKEKWDVNTAPISSKTINYTTDEGTWMNLDVSPDGKTIVFDMLGDIYSMPITGGKASPLRTGLAFEVQPQFSPDGKHILFTSDAGGGDNLWTMKADGSQAVQITEEKFRLLNNGVWMPEGDYVVARKHFSSTRSLGAGELWMYHITGGAGIQLTKRKNDQQDLGEPSITKDGRYIYYSEDMYPGGYFQYNKDPNRQITVVKRYDRETGEIKNIAGGPGGACRPQVSNDGKYLAFVKRVRTKSVLYLQDLETGEEWPIFDQLEKDQMEAWTVFGVYTNFAWLPNDKNIVIWGKGGKLWNVDVQAKKGTVIPFEVEAEHQICDALRFKQKIDTEAFTAKVIRHAVTSPDNKYLVFNAVGQLWKKKLPNGKPERLWKNEDILQFEPSFSKDGSQLLFVSWSDVEKGAIYKMNFKNNSTPQKITTKKGIYRSPKFSNNGKWIVYRKDGGNNHQGHAFTKEPGVYMMPSNGGEAELLTPQGINPQFSADDKLVYYEKGGFPFGGLSKSFNSISIDKREKKVIFNTKFTNTFTPSPDGNWVAFSELFKVYIAPMPKTGQAFALAAKTKAVPVALVSRDAGINLHWASDSKNLHWTLGEEYFSAALTNHFLFLNNAADSVPPLDTVGLRVGLELEMDKPEGQIALVGATIITMNGDKVIENGTILIENNKIKAIGTAGEINVNGKVKIIDVKGKTIMPGIVDVHGHLGNFRQGLSPQQQWEYFANLAYGVTTAHDPSSNTEMIFSQSEMIKSGRMIGPRLYSTGVILYGAEGDFKATINSLEDAKSALRRTKAFGAFSVKSYNQPRREQRQQVIKAAKELEMMVVPEGGSFFFHNMSMILDGHTGVEHNIPIGTAYKDVTALWGASQTGYTPTLIVNYGSVNGEYYWYQHTNVWEKERLLSFTPRGLVDARARHRTMLPEEEYENGHILTSKSCKKLADAGVKVNLGAHGQLQGLGAHWELWMLQQGGMTNMETLRSATLNGAHYIGLDDEIGSLEVGKLADLIVLDKNPLENIRNTETVIYTMLNGRLYDAATLNEIGNYNKKRLPFYWESDKYSESFPWHESSGSFTMPKCSCRQ